VLPFTREHARLERSGTIVGVRVAQLLVGALSFVVAVSLAIGGYRHGISTL
jgi:hypothetical protein